MKRLCGAALAVLLGFTIAVSAAGFTPDPAYADDCGVLQSGASPAAQRAVQEACRWVGVNYAWSGGHNGLPGPSQGTLDADPASWRDPAYWSFDCSGFVRWAWYIATGVDILTNGTAESAWNRLSADSRNQVFTPAQGSGPLLPGDILYYGDVSHTALYLGSGKMVESRQSGDLIKVSDWRPDRYKGAVRLPSDQPDPPHRYPGEGKAFKTWGAPNYRTGHDTSSAIKFVGNPGTSVYVRVLCQSNGEEITISGISNHVWSYLPDYEVWVSNIFIKGPAILPDVPPCSNYLLIGGEFTTPGGSDKNFSTWSTGVRVRTQPNTGSAIVQTFAGPTWIQVSCQAHAQPVTAEGFTNDVWAYLPEYGGWMTNIYIQGPAWLPNVPDCGGGTPPPSGNASCADNTVPSGNGARSPKSTVLYGRNIELRYSDVTQCAWGRISNGSINDEVWTDRSLDGGVTWQPRLGLTHIASGRDVFTTQFRDSGVVMRACGKAGDRVEIACTEWY